MAVFFVLASLIFRTHRQGTQLSRDEMETRALHDAWPSAFVEIEIDFIYVKLNKETKGREGGER